MLEVVRSGFNLHEKVVDVDFHVFPNKVTEHEVNQMLVCRSGVL